MAAADTTQCPHCAKAFKISSAQMAAADGLVRCGACYRLFQAVPSPHRGEAPTGRPLEPDQETLLANIEKAVLLTGIDDKYGPGSLAETEWRDRVIYNPLQEEQRWRFATSPTEVGFATVLLVILMAQSLWFFRDNLWDIPELKPALTSWCRLAECTEPRVTVHEPITISNLTVRSHPLVRDALQADFILRNNHPDAYPFPGLVLSFMDQEGSVVAQRTFAPEEYLAGELSGESIVPASYDIHVAVAVIDPGASAIRYQLDLTTPPGA